MGRRWFAVGLAALLTCVGTSAPAGEEPPDDHGPARWTSQTPRPFEVRGAPAPVEGIVTTGGSETLKLRTGPLRAEREITGIPDGTRVTISCQTAGDLVNGRVSETHVWDRVTFGGDTGYVAQAYIRIPSGGGNIPDCEGSAPGTDACPTGHGRVDGPPGTATGDTGERVRAVIDYARTFTGRGLNYAWGGGGKGGPSCGIEEPSPGGHDDFRRFGFDCSGLILHVFWSVLGIDVGANSNEQYRRGTPVSYDDLRPGDLVFLHGSNPERTVHVVLYLGDDRILEASAPRGPGAVHVGPMYRTGLMPHAVRVLA